MAQPPPPPPEQPPSEGWSPRSDYGGPPPSPYGGAPQYGAPTDGMAIAALICGIASFVACGPVTGIAAIILGTMSRNKIDQSGGAVGGRGMATAGLVLGWISVVITVLFIILFIVIAATGNLDDTDSMRAAGAALLD